MKHHIEAVISVPVCSMGGHKTITDDILLTTCYGEDYGEQGDCYCVPHEKDGTEIIGGRCVCLRFIEKRFAFDCTSYEFDEVEGFKSRGRTWDIESISKLVIDGEEIVPNKLTLHWPNEDD